MTINKNKHNQNNKNKHNKNKQLLFKLSTLSNPALLLTMLTGVYTNISYATADDSQLHTIQSNQAEKKNTPPPKKIMAQEMQREVQKPAVKVFKKYNLYGIQKNGKVVLPAEYDILKPITLDTSNFDSKKFYKSFKNDKFGLVSEDGTIILENKYDGLAVESRSSLIFAKTVDKWGIINIFGDTPNNKNSQQDTSTVQAIINPTLVIEPSLDSFEGNSNGLIKVSKDNKFGFINRNGIYIIQPQYDEIQNFGNQDLAIVRLADKFGVINTKGETLLKPIYDAITESPISNGTSEHDYNHASYKVKQSDMYALFDLQGIPFTTFAFDEIIDERNDYNRCRKAFIFKKNNKYGLINKHNKAIVPAKYDDVEHSEYGNCLFQSKLDNKHGFLNDEGEFIAPKFDVINHDSDSNYFYTFNNDLVGILNDKGKQIVPNKYNIKGGHHLQIKSISYLKNIQDDKTDKVRNAEQDLPLSKYIKKETVIIITLKNNKAGILDNEGKTLFDTIYDDIEFYDSLIVLTQGGKKSIAKVTGEVIVPLSLLGKNQEYGVFELRHHENNKIIFDGKAGILNPAGDWIIEPAKQEIDTLNTNNISVYYNLSQAALYIIKREHNASYSATPDEKSKQSQERWAVTNIEGKYISDFVSISKPKLDSGLIIFDENGSFGIMDVVGNKLIAPEYDTLKISKKGVNVGKNGKMGRINFRGKTIIPIAFDNIMNLNHSDNYLRVTQGNKYGLFNTQGYEILPINFDRIFEPDDMLYTSNGLLTVQDDNMSLYDHFGNKLNKKNYEKISTFQDNVFLVKQPHNINKFGLIDLHGNELLPAEFEGIKPSAKTSQQVWVKKEGKWWLIVIDNYKKNGKTLSTVGFDWIDLSYSDTMGLLAVRDENKYGFVDEQGEIVIPLQYDAVEKFNTYGIAEVIKYGKSIYIDSKGNTVQF